MKQLEKTLLALSLGCVLLLQGASAEAETCIDENAYCADWAQSGECTENPDYMLESCCLSCTEVGSVPVSYCEEDSDCYMYALGADCVDNRCVECHEHGDCAGSERCLNNLCVEPDCIDTNVRCADWAQRGECTINPGYMLENCCFSCREGVNPACFEHMDCPAGTACIDNQCIAGPGPGPDCTDENAYCADWARNGECTRNPGYMQESCCASCNPVGHYCEDDSDCTFTSHLVCDGYGWVNFDGVWEYLGTCHNEPYPGP